MCRRCPKYQSHPRCERCGVFGPPLLRVDAKWDNLEHVTCPACWRAAWAEVRGKQPITQAQADEDYELHLARFNASAQALPPDVAAAIGRPPLKWFPQPKPRPHVGWDVRCAIEGCRLTALYKQPTCAWHLGTATS